MSDDQDTRPFGLRATTDEVLDRIRALGDTVRTTAGTALGAGQDVPVVGDLLASMQRLVEQAPAPTAQLDLFLEELGAKRALVTAFQAQLTSLDHQMEILQRSLQPVSEWGRQWSRVQDGLADGLRVLLPGEGDDDHGDGDASGSDSAGSDASGSDASGKDSSDDGSSGTG